MEKQIMISAVISKITAIGINTVNADTSDVLINQEFSAGGLGNKKIKYQASAFFNEKDKTVYLWELTTETGSGVSFGGDNEMSFQSGKTLFRKIKSVQYDSDGKPYEINIDLGSITRAFKETAQQYGWKFKTVLRREKASYSKAYIANGIDDKTNEHVSKQSDLENKGFIANGGLFWILYILFSILTVLFFGVGGISILGWIFAIAIFVSLFFMFRTIIQKSFILQGIVWIFTFVILLIIMGLTAPTDSKTQDSSKITAKETAQLKKAQKQEPVFAMTAIRTFIFGHSTSKLVNQETYYTPIVNLTSFIDLNTLKFGSNGTTDIKKVNIDNINIIKKPKKGNILTYAYLGAENVDDSKYSSKKNYEFSLNEGMSGFSIILDTKINEIHDYYLPPQKSDGSISSDEYILQKAGVTWEELKYKIEYDLKITTKSGDKYTKHIVLELPQGDFINDKKFINYDINYDMKNDITKAMFVKD